MIGQKLNKRYKVTAQIGKGAMGTVYRATDTLTRQDVALKVIANELAIDPAMLERFKREGEALRQLKHPNIVGFIDAFPHQNYYVIVMEYISGGNLFQLIKKSPLSIERTQQIGLDLCDALIRAHRLNIIHRDIKPENVLIDEDGTPKLADFGVARISAGTRMTRTGTQVGTPYYMAPEAWEGKPLDAQADIWSLGVVLFEMLTGQVPFDGDTGPVVMTKVLTKEPPDLNEIRADVPPEFVKIITRMLTRDKDLRYQTMREVSVDLERVRLPVKADYAGKATRIIRNQDAADKAEREREAAAKKNAREKAEIEATEKARLEAEEQMRQKAANEKAEHETTEKVVLEKAAPEKANSEFIEKIKRDNAKPEVTEKVTSASPSEKIAEFLKPYFKSRPAQLFWGVVLLISGFILLWYAILLHPL